MRLFHPSKLPLVVPIVIVVAGLIGCDSNDPAVDDQTVDPVDDRTALLEADKSFAAAASVGDIQKVMSSWADDAINYFPDAPPAIGKEAIGDLVRRNRTIPGFSLSWEPNSATAATSGDFGYTTGTFRLTVNDPQGNQIVRTGHYVSIWVKHADGSWKVALEMSTFGPS